MPLVLYVGRSKVDPTQFCKGSELCIQAVSERGLSEIVTVQEVEKVRQQVPLPPWIDGTPILVDTEEMVPLRGSVALRELKRFVVGGVDKRGRRSASPPERSRADVEEQDKVRMGGGGKGEEMLPFPPAQIGADGSVRQEATASLASASVSHAEEEEEEEDLSKMVYSDTDRPVNSGKVTEKDLQAFIASRKR